MPDQRLAGRRVVALVEHEVEDAKHRLQALGEAVRGRHLVGDPGVANLLLGPHQALRQRRLRDQEGPGDLRRRQAAQRAEGQRDARLRGERGVAAGEDQSQLVVGDGSHLVLRGRQERRPAPGGLERLVAGERLHLVREPPGAPGAVDRPVAGGRGDPGPGVRRHAVSRPALERDDVRVRNRLLGQVEVAQDANQGGDHPPVLVPEDAGNRVARVRAQPISRIGRISMWPVRAPGIRAAASIAASRSLALIR